MYEAGLATREMEEASDEMEDTNDITEDVSDKMENTSKDMEDASAQEDATSDKAPSTISDASNDSNPIYMATIITVVPWILIIYSRLPSLLLCLKQP
jgi:hypothetical protein